MGHDKVIREKGFDRHTASAYLIALKGLKIIKNNELLRKKSYRPCPLKTEEVCALGLSILFGKIKVNIMHQSPIS